MSNPRTARNGAKTMIVRVLAIALLVAAAVGFPGELPGNSKTVEAACWDTVPLCNIISKYAVSYNGGFGGGSYDISFTLKAGNQSSGSCGSGQADFWYLDDSCEGSFPPNGTGENQSQFIVRVYPCDSSRTQAFNAYVKLKAYDSLGNPIKSGGGPSPYFIDPTDFPTVGTVIQYDCSGNPI